MTEKKITILQTALELFSEQGFNATSTAKIAKTANVSEGLIFRHFGNKEGLLESIMELGKEKAADLFNKLLVYDNPKDRLKAIINIPLSIPSTEYPFWKLLYALKWQTDAYDSEMSLKIKLLLVDVFTALKYKEAELEAELVLMLFDGMSTAILLKNFKETERIKHIIYNKYNLI